MIQGLLEVVAVVRTKDDGHPEGGDVGQDRDK